MLSRSRTDLRTVFCPPRATPAGRVARKPAHLRNAGRAPANGWPIVRVRLRRSRQLRAVHPDHRDALDPRHPSVQVVQPLLNAVDAHLQAGDSLETQPCNRKVESRQEDPERDERNSLFPLHTASSRFPAVEPLRAPGVVKRQGVPSALRTHQDPRDPSGGSPPPPSRGESLQNCGFQQTDRPPVRVHLGAAPDGQRELLGDVPDHAPPEGRDTQWGDVVFEHLLQGERAES